MNNTHWEYKYAELIRDVLTTGEKRHTRAGDAYSVFGRALEVDISKEFPLLRGRKMFPGPIFGELAAMLRGPKHVQDFRDQGCNYWESWADGQGELALDYGNAWIDFNGVNQLEVLVNTLKTNPTDRRMIVTGWRPDRLDQLSLPCCHILYQWYVRKNKDGADYLDMIWYQRSVDVMVGLPSDIVLAAMWTMLLANECGFQPGKVTMMLGDTHVYANHSEGVNDYLRNLNNRAVETFGTLIHYTLDKSATVFNFTPDMMRINNYAHAPAIKFSLNV